MTPKSTTRAELVALMSDMAGLLSARNFSEINLRLEMADWTDLSTDFVAALPRLTAVAKQWLPQWSIALLEATAELERRGLPAAQIMRGLDAGNAVTGIGLPSA